MSRTCGAFSSITAINVLTLDLEQVPVDVCECVFMTFKYPHTHPVSATGNGRHGICAAVIVNLLDKLSQFGINLHQIDLQFKFTINIKSLIMSDERSFAQRCGTICWMKVRIMTWQSWFTFWCLYYMFVICDLFDYNIWFSCTRLCMYILAADVHSHDFDGLWLCMHTSCLQVVLVHCNTWCKKNNKLLPTAF